MEAKKQFLTNSQPDGETRPQNDFAKSFESIKVLSHAATWWAARCTAVHFGGYVNSFFG